jgi:succinate-semialdehyde dehydrogenase / glutarate-semialdehyde dehydrogenase
MCDDIDPVSSAGTFVDAFAANAATIQVGNGLDSDNQIGPLANDRRLAAMEMLVADAKPEGARVTAGGSRIGNRGYFFPLTVLADVPDDGRAMREEPFGPLALLSRVRTVDEAIEKANSVPYGLAADAFTNSARNVDRRIGWPRASRSAISRSTNSWHRAPKPRSAASRTAASRGRAAPKDCSATPW